jgi:HicB family
MELHRYADALRRDLLIAAAVGDEDSQATAERLTAALEPAIRLMLLEALSDAASEITRELAPGSVELRLRAGELEFVVAAEPADEPLPATAAPLPAPADGEDGTVARINLRLPEQLKAAVEHAAASERLSVNAWLVRAVAAALARDDRGDQRPTRAGRPGQAYTGWVR